MRRRFWRPGSSEQQPPGERRRVGRWVLATLAPALVVVCGVWQTRVRRLYEPKHDALGLERSNDFTIRATFTALYPSQLKGVDEPGLVPFRNPRCVHRRVRSLLSLPSALYSLCFLLSAFCSLL